MKSSFHVFQPSQKAVFHCKILSFKMKSTSFDWLWCSFPLLEVYTGVVVLSTARGQCKRWKKSPLLSVKTKLLTYFQCLAQSVHSCSAKHCTSHSDRSSLCNPNLRVECKDKASIPLWDVSQMFLKQNQDVFFRDLSKQCLILCFAALPLTY